MMLWLNFARMEKTRRAPFLLCSSMDVRMPPPLKMEALTWFHCSSSKNLMLLLT